MKKIKTTLNQNSEFSIVYKKGNSIVSKNLVTYYKKNGLAYSRVGVTASKKIGTAVRRNRARRIIKESFRAYDKSLLSGYDFVFVARGKTPFEKTGDIHKTMKNQFSKAGLFLTET